MTPARPVDPPSPRSVSEPGDRDRSFETARSRSRKALFALIAPRGSCEEAAVEGVDWDWTIERARAHKVGALLAARLRSSAVWTRLTPAQRAALDAANVRAEAVVGSAERTIRLLDRHLREGGIPYLVTKGVVLSRLVYPASNLRSFSDLDIVVPPQSVGAAVAVLQSHGYRQGQVRQTLGARPNERQAPAALRMTRRFYERFDHELPFVAPAGSGLLPVDLHWRIATRRRLAIATDALWQEGRRVRLADVEVSTLSPEATLIHLALHATTCSFAAFRLLHLCDVAWAVDRSKHDPERLWDLAARWGAAHHVGVVLAMASLLFGTPLPPSRSAAAAPTLATDASFLLDPPPRALPLRLWKEAVWGISVGCLGHNLARSAAVQWTRALWWSRRVLAWPRL